VKTTWLPVAAIATTLIFWASAFVAIRHLGVDVPAGALSLGRLLVGSLALGSLVLVRSLKGRPARRPAARDWVPLVTCGVLWFGVYNVALNEAERRVDAGTAAMLINIGPLLIAVLAVFFLRERMTPWLVLGFVVAFGGVIVIALATASGSGRDLVGVFLLVLAAASYAVSVIAQKPLLARLPALEVTWIACTIGAIVCLPFLGDLVDVVRRSSAADLGWIAYLGVFPTAIAFTTWAFALSHSDAGRLGVTTYLVPPLTILLGWLLLQEVPPALAFLGGAMCLLGVAIARRPAKTPIEEPAMTA
jgi:drug/metabolite transporter (DMT)-like permease